MNRNLRIWGALMLSLVSITMLATPLSPSESLARVKKSSALRMTSNPVLAMTVNDAYMVPALYVFTYPSTGGFLITAADDAATPLLGYSDSENFDSDNIPSGLRYMLNLYSEEIAWLKRQPTYNSIRIEESYNSYNYEPISPLCSTKWNQSDPYNLLCPVYSGSRSVTGCVATAMAQIIKYHNYPAKGVGKKTYTYNGVTMTYNYADTTFRWTSMLNTYTSSASTTQKYAVASLMYGCGVGVEMMYSPSASGAYSENVADALKNYFNFAPSTTGIPRSIINTKSWNDMVYQSLKDKCPVYVAGGNPTGAHAFVADGYSSDGFFHINWGWGGSSDGYFLLSALDPRSQGIGGSSAGYNANGYIITMAQPNTTSKKQPYIFLQHTDAYQTPSISDMTLTLPGQIVNMAAVDTKCWFGAKFTCLDGKVVYVSEDQERSISGLQSDYSAIEVSLEKLTQDGEYKVEPYINAGTESNPDWRMVYRQTDAPLYYIFYKQGDKFTIKQFATPDKYPSVKDMKFYSPLYAGYPISMSVRLNNYTENYEYIGNLYALLLTKDGKSAVTYMGPQIYSLMPGEEKKYSFDYSWRTSVTAGDYQLCMATTNENGYFVRISESMPITIKEAPSGTPEITVTNFGPATGLIYTDKQTFTCNVKCTSGYFAGNFYLFLFNGSNTYLNINSITPNVYVDNGTTKSCSFDTYWNLSPNTDYYVQLQNGNKYISKVKFCTPLTVGIDKVESDNNPFNINEPIMGKFEISAPNAISSLKLYSMSGNIMYAPVSIIDAEAELDASLLPKGVYVLQISTSEGDYTAKIIVR